MDIIPSTGDFGLLQVDPDLVPCVLEPPWIRRCKYGVKFTDEISVLDSVGSNGEGTERSNKNAKSNCSSNSLKFS